jgi:hypothetical protein
VSWYKVTFNTDYDRPLETPLKLALKANEIYTTNGSPSGFALFSELDDAFQYFTLYFSPVAADYCRSLIAPYSPTPCDKPDPSKSTASFKLTAGNRKGWDLLK